MSLPRAFLLSLFVVGWSLSIGACKEDAEPPDCAAGDTRASDTACGLNDRGTITQECQDGSWVDTNTCDDPDECVDDDTQTGTTACGYNGRGVLGQECVSGSWTDTGNCDDPDECVDDDREGTACGVDDSGVQAQVCVAGAWQSSGPCLDRPYLCPELTGTACSTYAGTYQMETGGALFYVNDSDFLGDSTPVAYNNYLAGSQGPSPLNVCSETVGAMATRLTSLKLTLQVEDNCSASIFFQHDGYTDSVTGACAELVVDTSGQVDQWDLIFADDHSGLGPDDSGLEWLFFGDQASTNDSVVGLIDGDTLTVAVDNAIDETDMAAACLADLNAAVAERLEFHDAVASTPWEDGVTGIWDFLTSTFSNFASLVTEFQNKLGDLDGDATDSGIRTGIALGDANSLRVRNLLSNSDPADKALASDFRPELDLQGKLQKYRFPMTKTCVGNCLPVPPDLDQVTWPSKGKGQAFLTDLVPPLPEKEGRRLWLVVNGRVRIKMPRISDLINDCDEIATACTEVVGDTNLQSMVSTAYVLDPDCVAIDDFCAALEDVADGSIDWTAVPWQGTHYLGFDTTALEYNSSECFDPDAGTPSLDKRACLLTALDHLLETFSTLPVSLDENPADGEVDDVVFDFARVVLLDTSVGTPAIPELTVTVSDGTTNFTLAKNPTLTDFAQWIRDRLEGPALGLDELVADIEAEYGAQHVATYGLNSRDTSGFVWEHSTPFTLGVAPLVSSDYPFPAANRATVTSPKELNVCQPRGMILDNLFFPTIRWNGVYDADIQTWLDNRNVSATREQANPLSLTASERTPARDDFVDYFEVGRDIVSEYVDANAGTLRALPYASLFLTTSNIIDISHPLTSHCPACYPLQDQVDFRVVPDLGLFTETYLGWWDLAPTGRDYMMTPQEVIDYVFHIVISRSNRQYLTATELYGTDVAPELAEDGALLVSLNLVYKPVVVINSDLFPGGNFTHFWRRDIFGALMQDPCDDMP